MSPKGKGPTIWLIPEDKTGFYVFQAILREKKLIAHIRSLGSASGISQLAEQLEALIDTTLRQKSLTDCIVVLHDTDDSVQRFRRDYDSVRAICENEIYKPHVTRLAAVQEIESWLLADNRLCKWLATKSRASDHIPQPSKVFAKLLNDKKGMKWNELNKPKILQHMDASGDKLSPSMREAMHIFLNLPCTQSIP